MTEEVRSGGELLATLEGGSFEPVEPLALGTPLVLSRFAWIRRDSDTLVAETSLGPRVVRFHDHRCPALMLAFVQPRQFDAALVADVGLAPDVAAAVASLLVAAALLIDQESADAELEPPLALWEFHDLLFHVRSRGGRHHNPVGGTYRLLGMVDPAPGYPERRWAETVPLAKPDIDRYERDDPRLFGAQTSRVSTRIYGTAALSLEQLGAFLYRVGRVEDIWDMGVTGAGRRRVLTYAPRPYPSAGSMYPLELYVAVRRCDGLTPGLYHYRGDEHALAWVSGWTDGVASVLDQSAGSLGVQAEMMQAVIVITARMRRTAWKYQSIAYQLILKDVGVAMEAMYLTAAALDLAACAIGVGDSDLFARVSGLDPHDEPAVGEFALGSREP